MTMNLGGQMASASESKNILLAPLGSPKADF